MYMLGRWAVLRWNSSRPHRNFELPYRDHVWQRAINFKLHSLSPSPSYTIEWRKWCIKMPMLAQTTATIARSWAVWFIPSASARSLSSTGNTLICGGSVPKIRFQSVNLSCCHPAGKARQRSKVFTGNSFSHNNALAPHISKDHHQNTF